MGEGDPDPVAVHLDAVPGQRLSRTPLKAENQHLPVGFLGAGKEVPAPRPPGGLLDLRGAELGWDPPHNQTLN